MKKIKYDKWYGWIGDSYTEELEVKDDLTDEEIEILVKKIINEDNNCWEK